MTTKARLELTYLPWLSLPLVLISYLILWNRLPAEMTVHFDLKGAPNGWMSKWASLASSLAALLIILLFSTAKLMYKEKRDHGTHPKDLLRHCLSVGAITIILMGVLIYNVW
jgi:uncharacterized membrane protein